jgi:DnaJ-class molecular chaperone
MGNSDSYEGLFDRDEDVMSDPCPTCDGSGELGPYGWEYPEWETCPDCRGSGRESDHDDPDRKFEERRDRDP